MIWQTGWLCPLPDQETEAQPLFLIPQTPEGAPPAQEYMAVEVFLMQGHKVSLQALVVSWREPRTNAEWAGPLKCAPQGPAHLGSCKCKCIFLQNARVIPLLFP